jgi:hypothetical protein
MSEKGNVAIPWATTATHISRLSALKYGIHPDRSVASLPIQGGGNHKAFCTSVFLLLQRYWV